MSQIASTQWKSERLCPKVVVADNWTGEMANSNGVWLRVRQEIVVGPLDLNSKEATISSSFCGAVICCH